MSRYGRTGLGFSVVKESNLIDTTKSIQSVCCLVLILLVFPIAAHGECALLVGPLNTAEILSYDCSSGAPLPPFATGHELDNSTLMAIGPDGDIYVANGANDSVDRFDWPTGNYIPTGISIDSAAGLAFGPTGDMYVSNGNPPFGLFRYHWNGTSWTEVPGPVYSNSISGIAFDCHGSLYISTYAGNSVLKWNDPNSTFDDFVSPGSGGLSLAKNIMFGPDGDLYVCGGYNDAIMRYDGVTGLPKGIAPGDARFAYGGGLDLPSDLDFGLDGNLYVVGTRHPSYAHHGVLRYNGSTGDFMDVFGEAAVGSESLIFVPQPAALLSSDPPPDGTLPKTANNVIQLTFNAPITLPADPNEPPLTITAIAGGPELGSQFTYQIDPNDPTGKTLKAVENGEVLTNLVWYRITPTAGFDVMPFTLDVATLAVRVA